MKDFNLEIVERLSSLETNSKSTVEDVREIKRDLKFITKDYNETKTCSKQAFDRTSTNRTFLLSYVAVSLSILAGVIIKIVV